MAAAVTLAAGCGSTGRPAGGGHRITLYTCVTAGVEQRVVSAFERSDAATTVAVFRAPTAALNARVAGDLRAGGLRADVIWACDPLTMHGYDRQGLLARWPGAPAAGVPAAERSARWTGADVLDVVLVVHRGVPAPRRWWDLAGPAYRDAVAIPSATFAASALGLLGYFATTPGYGLGYYRALRRNGAVAVDSPDQVLTGVEQGTYRAGITLAAAAEAAVRTGAPVRVVWPRPAAVAIAGPVALTRRGAGSAGAAAFTRFVVGRTGQRVLAAAGGYPVLAGVGGAGPPAGARAVVPPWPRIYPRIAGLLAGYARIFSG